jgi:hypothetical protein
MSPPRVVSNFARASRQLLLVLDVVSNSAPTFHLAHVFFATRHPSTAARLLKFLLIFFAATLIISETLQFRVNHLGDTTKSTYDRAALYLGFLITMVSALVILYYLLPDSIRSGVSRSAHDYYVGSKKKLNLQPCFAPCALQPLSYCHCTKIFQRWAFKCGLDYTLGYIKVTPPPPLPSHAAALSMTYYICFLFYFTTSVPSARSV